MNVLEELTLLSGTLEVGVHPSQEFRNNGAAGMVLTLDIPSNPAGTLTTLELQVPVGDGWFTVAAFGSMTMTAQGKFAFLIYPGEMDAGTWTATPIKCPLPMRFRVQATITTGTFGCQLEGHLVA